MFEVVLSIGTILDLFPFPLSLMVVVSPKYISFNLISHSSYTLAPVSYNTANIILCFNPVIEFSFGQLINSLIVSISR